jgi:hypothetical protein
MLGGHPNTCGGKAARLQYRAKEKLAKKDFQNQAKPRARTRKKWVKNAGSRITEPALTDNQANETWEDVPLLEKKHVTETKEDKSQKGLLCVFIDILFMLSTYMTSSRQGQRRNSWEL